MMNGNGFGLVSRGGRYLLGRLFGGLRGFQLGVLAGLGYTFASGISTLIGDLKRIQVILLVVAIIVVTVYIITRFEKRVIEEDKEFFSTDDDDKESE